MAMTLGAFACILAMRRREGMVEEIGDLAGLSRTHPVMAFMLAMILFSLAGIPPLAGFFAKFYVFLAAIESGLYVLAVIGVLASVVGAYYYLRIIKIMYFDEPAPGFEPMAPELRVVLGISRRLRPPLRPRRRPGRQRGRYRRGDVLPHRMMAGGLPSGIAERRTTAFPRPVRGRWRWRAPAIRAALGHRRRADRGPRPAGQGMDAPAAATLPPRSSSSIRPSRRLPPPSPSSPAWRSIRRASICAGPGASPSG